jgi:hypothetical protein
MTDHYRRRGDAPDRIAGDESPATDRNSHRARLGCVGHHDSAIHDQS